MRENTSDEIVSLFFETFRLFKQKMDWGNPLYQLPLAQMEALRFVEEKKQVQMKDVADFLAITPPSATVLTNNLVRLGYVKRESDKLDRRTILLSLTKKGSSALQKGIKNRCEKLKLLLDNLSQKEKLEFIHILKKMTTNN